MNNSHLVEKVFSQNGRRLNVKPLSVNKIWQGRRFKTHEYLDWEELLLYTLPRVLGIPQGEICLYLEFGLSNRNADIDNSIKPFIDVLQKKYGFNDRQIYDLHVKKVIVPKGEEYIAFDFSEKSEKSS